MDPLTIGLGLAAGLAARKLRIAFFDAAAVAQRVAFPARGWRLLIDPRLPDLIDPSFANPTAIAAYLAGATLARVTPHRQQ